jgi:hypothetical protein
VEGLVAEKTQKKAEFCEKRGYALRELSDHSLDLEAPRLRLPSHLLTMYTRTRFQALGFCGFSFFSLLFKMFPLFVCSLLVEALCWCCLLHCVAVVMYLHCGVFGFVNFCLVCLVFEFSFFPLFLLLFFLFFLF